MQSCHAGYRQRWPSSINSNRCPPPLPIMAPPASRHLPASLIDRNTRTRTDGPGIRHIQTANKLRKAPWECWNARRVPTNAADNMLSVGGWRYFVRAQGTGRCRSPSPLMSYASSLSPHLVPLCLRSFFFPPPLTSPLPLSPPNTGSPIGTTITRRWPKGFSPDAIEPLLSFSFHHCQNTFST